MYLIEKDEEFRFKARPWFACPTALIIMAKEKSGKTTAISNVPKMQVCQFDRNASKVEVLNFVDMLLYRKIPKERLGEITIGTKSKPNSSPKLYVTNKLDGTGYHVPPSIYDLALEVNPEIKLYKKKVEDLQVAQAKRDQADYDAKLEELRRYVSKEMSCPIMAIDNLTSIMEEIYECALRDYWTKFPHQVNKKLSVKDVDNWGGTQYIRAALRNTCNFIYENLAPIVIFIGHTAAKVVNKDNLEMTATDLDMEGKLGAILTTAVDSVCILHRKEDDGIYLNFQKNADDQPTGSRCPYLDNRDLKIAEWAKEGEDPTRVAKYWDEVFPEIYK